MSFSLIFIIPIILIIIFIVMLFQKADNKKLKIINLIIQTLNLILTPFIFLYIGMSSEYLINFQEKINLFINIITEPLLYYLTWLILLILSIIFSFQKKYILAILMLINIMVLVGINMIINFIVSEIII